MAKHSNWRKLRSSHAAKVYLFVIGLSRPYGKRQWSNLKSLMNLIWLIKVYVAIRYYNTHDCNVRASNRRVFLITQNVTKNIWLQCYVARGSPSRLQSLFDIEKRLAFIWFSCVSSLCCDLILDLLSPLAKFLECIAFSSLRRWLQKYMLYWLIFCLIYTIRWPKKRKKCVFEFWMNKSVNFHSERQTVYSFCLEWNLHILHDDFWIVSFEMLF